MNLKMVPEIWFMLSGVVYLLGLIICLLTASTNFTIGFCVGGGLVLINSWTAARKLKKAPFPHKPQVMASVLGGFYLRLVILGICLYGVIRFLSVDPLGLIAGVSVVPAGLMVMLMLIYIANRRPEEA